MAAWAQGQRASRHSAGVVPASKVAVRHWSWGRPLGHPGTWVALLWRFRRAWQIQGAVVDSRQQRRRRRWMAGQWRVGDQVPTPSSSQQAFNLLGAVQTGIIAGLGRGSAHEALEVGIQGAPSSLSHPGPGNPKRFKSLAARWAPAFAQPGRRDGGRRCPGSRADWLRPGGEKLIKSSLQKLRKYFTPAFSLFPAPSLAPCSLPLSSFLPSLPASSFSLSSLLSFSLSAFSFS